jgi:malate synthase A
MSMLGTIPAGARLRARYDPRHDRVLTDGAIAFVIDLARTFGPRVAELLKHRRERRLRVTQFGERFDFLPTTARVREANWAVTPLPEDLIDRRVEITGPAERKMIINALNSGASVFMADFEDSLSPTWDNLVSGQVNLFDAVRRTITFRTDGKLYALTDRPAVLMVRPRGLHLPEKHVLCDGEPIPGALFDFGLFVYHNARSLVARGTGPYVYLPKLESHNEARLWNDTFLYTEGRLGLRPGTIKATCLIETLPAAFEMDEILYELREHSAGLNCGRWDYIFSYIKNLAHDPSKVLPDRAEVTMDKGFLLAYVDLLIHTCHRRGVHAMGGMAAQIPIKDDPIQNEIAFAKVRSDKVREVTQGHDGTWVAHPGLVPVARAVFDAHMPDKNQIGRMRSDVSVTAEDLLRPPGGSPTEEGLRQNVRVAIQYLEAWLHGHGSVPLYHLMEDAATAEISRTQAWQWLHHGVFAPGFFARVVEEEIAGLGGGFARARELFERLCLAEACEEFLTLPAYDVLLATEEKHAHPRHERIHR